MNMNSFKTCHTNVNNTGTSNNVPENPSAVTAENQANNRSTESDGEQDVSLDTDSEGTSVSSNHSAHGECNGVENTPRTRLEIQQAQLINQFRIREREMMEQAYYNYNQQRTMYNGVPYMPNNGYGRNVGGQCPLNIYESGPYNGYSSTYQGQGSGWSYNHPCSPNGMGNNFMYPSMDMRYDCRWQNHNTLCNNGYPINCFNNNYPTNAVPYHQHQQFGSMQPGQLGASHSVSMPVASHTCATSHRVVTNDDTSAQPMAEAQIVAVSPLKQAPVKQVAKTRTEKATASSVKKKPKKQDERDDSEESNDREDDEEADEDRYAEANGDGGGDDGDDGDDDEDDDEDEGDDDDDDGQKNRIDALPIAKMSLVKSHTTVSTSIINVNPAPPPKYGKETLDFRGLQRLQNDALDYVTSREYSIDYHLSSSIPQNIATTLKVLLRGNTEWWIKSKSDFGSDSATLSPDTGCKFAELTIPAAAESGPLPWLFTTENKLKNLEGVTKEDLRRYANNPASFKRMDDRLFLTLCAKHLRLGSNIRSNYFYRILGQEALKTYPDWYSFIDNLENLIHYVSVYGAWTLENGSYIRLTNQLYEKKVKAELIKLVKHCPLSKNDSISDRIQSYREMKLSEILTEIMAALLTTPAGDFSQI